MDRVLRAREALVERRNAAEQALVAGPPCVDCRHFGLTGACNSPAYQMTNHNLVTGEVTTASVARAEEARADGGLCGTEALLFEDKPLAFQAAKAVGSGVYAAVRPIVTGIAYTGFGVGILSAIYTLIQAI